MELEIEIITGAMDAGKTTFLNTYLNMLDGDVTVIENGVGTEPLRIPEGRDIPVYEIENGCICCSLSLEFQRVLSEIGKSGKQKVIVKTSGISKASDVARTCIQVGERTGRGIHVEKIITIVDVSVFDEYLDAMGAFYQDQIQNASVLLLSHQDDIAADEMEEIVRRIHKIQPEAYLCRGNWYRDDPKVRESIIKEISRFGRELQEEEFFYPSDGSLGGFRRKSKGNRYYKLKY